MALYLTEEDVGRLLTMDMALEAVEEGFRLQAQGKATNRPRGRLRLPGGFFHLMAAAAPGLGVMGLKAYASLGGPGPRFFVHLSSSETGELLALMEASRLGQVRTGAASGVATKYMARQDAAVVGVIGAGYQAETQLEAVCKVRPIREARVFSRTPERRQAFARRMSERLALDVKAVEDAEACVRGADIIVTITNSTSPVLLGRWLEAGVHVNAAGANHWLCRELDDEAVGRADLIVADDVEQAKIEAGALMYAVERGTITWAQVRELWQVVSRELPGRRSQSDVTLFKSLGVALEDVTTAYYVYRRALEEGVGRPLPAGA